MFTLKSLAQAGYVLGLDTIGEVYGHMTSHWHAYFAPPEEVEDQINQLNAVVTGNLNDSIDKYLTAEDKAKMDAELDEVLGDKSKDV